MYRQNTLSIYYPCQVELDKLRYPVKPNEMVTAKSFQMNYGTLLFCLILKGCSLPLIQLFYLLKPIVHRPVILRYEAKETIKLSFGMDSEFAN